MKKYNVTLDVDAEDDLFEIYAFIALNESIKRADNVFSLLHRTCNKLATLPMRGNIPTELFEIGVTEFREIHQKPYRIIYSVEATTVYVHCILDGRRDLQTILQERLMR
jgi:toxin ParE1/3/4